MLHITHWHQLVAGNSRQAGQYQPVLLDTASRQCAAEIFLTNNITTMDSLRHFSSATSHIMPLLCSALFNGSEYDYACVKMNIASVEHWITNKSPFWYHPYISQLKSNLGLWDVIVSLWQLKYYKIPNTICTTMSLCTIYMKISQSN